MTACDDLSLLEGRVLAASRASLFRRHAAGAEWMPRNRCQHSFAQHASDQEWPSKVRTAAMNNSLADPFDSAHEYPESLTGQLSMVLEHACHRRVTYLDQDQDIRPAFVSIAKATFLLPAGYAHKSEEAMAVIVRLTCLRRLMARSLYGTSKRVALHANYVDTLVRFSR